MALPAYPPAPKAMPDIAAAMGGEPVETLWHAGGYVLIVYADATSVRALEPDLRALKAGGDMLYIATAPGAGDPSGADRSEEHKSELQSLMRNSYAVLCVKKKKRQ